MGLEEKTPNPPAGKVSHCQSGGHKHFSDKTPIRWANGSARSVIAAVFYVDSLVANATTTADCYIPKREPPKGPAAPVSSIVAPAAEQVLTDPPATTTFKSNKGPIPNKEWKGLKVQALRAEGLKLQKLIESLKSMEMPQVAAPLEASLQRFNLLLQVLCANAGESASIKPEHRRFASICHLAHHTAHMQHV